LDYAVLVYIGVNCKQLRFNNTTGEHHIMFEIIFFIVIGALVGGISVLIFALLKKPISCPKCNTKMPRFRKPENTNQALWGGWTCPKCGTELDKKGNEIKNK